MYEKLFTKNNGIYKERIYKDNNRIIYKAKNTTINRNELKRMIIFANFVNKPNYKLIDVVIDLSNNLFCDKLTYILCEYICMYIQNEKRSVYLLLNDKYTIDTSGIQYSPLRYLQYRDKNIRQKFYESFDHNIYRGHYRRMSHITDEHVEELPSLLMTDIKFMLKNIGTNIESSTDIATVVSELVDNGMDHGRHDVLLDIDISNDYVKKNEDGVYYGVNIVVLNFSDILLKSRVEKKIKENKYIDSRMR